MIRKEEPPYEFKIHLFLDKNGEEGAERAEAATSRELSLKIMQKLDEFEAKNVRDSIGNQPNRQDKGGAKIRYTFQIDERDKALSCYKFFIDYE